MLHVIAVQHLWSTFFQHLVYRSTFHFSFFWSVRIPKIVDFYDKDNSETIYKSITKGIQIVKFVISLLLNASMWSVFARPMNEVMHHLAEKMKARWLSLTWICVWTRRELSLFLFESLLETVWKLLMPFE